MRRKLGRWMAMALITSAVMAMPATASAHPLGNFTINHHLAIHVTDDGLELDYVLDMAEIPAFTEIRALGGDDPQALRLYGQTECRSVSRGLNVSLDGNPIDLVMIGSRVTTPPGDSGVPTLRLECTFESDINNGTLTIENNNYDDRIGWREMIATSSRVPISTDLPSESSSAHLTSYPDNELSAVPDIRQATIGIGEGPIVEGGGTGPPPVAALGALVRVESLGLASGLIAVLGALALGTGHALAPGHGKTIVAAYLVGTRGTSRQAVVLALATALSHTVGVAVLGVIAATAAVTFEPTTIYPYLSTLAGLVVFLIGTRLLWRLLRPQSHHSHTHGHDHHHRSQHDTAPLGWKSVAALGLSGGLVPSASAVVLLLGAIHIGHAWFGVLLVAVFGIGMSVALVASGLIAVLAHRWGWNRLPRRNSPGRVAHWAPRLAAAAVVFLGVVMTVTGIDDLSNIW